MSATKSGISPSLNPETRISLRSIQATLATNKNGIKSDDRAYSDRIHLTTALGWFALNECSPDECNEIRDLTLSHSGNPDSAALHPGYACSASPAGSVDWNCLAESLQWVTQAIANARAKRFRRAAGKVGHSGPYPGLLLVGAGADNRQIQH